MIPAEVAQEQPPRLLHTLQVRDSGAVLSVVTGLDRIYASDKDGSIYIWNAETLALENEIKPHSRAILSLILVPKRKWIVSASSDNTIQIHHAITLMHVATVNAINNTGTIFSLVWMPNINTLFFGSQNTSIQWHCMPPNLAGTSSPINTVSGSRGKELFFFSSSSGNSSPEHRRSYSNLANALPPAQTSIAEASRSHSLNIQPECILHSAHPGYVYALAVTQKGKLVSAGGCGSIKVWNPSEDGPLHLDATLPPAKTGILCLATQGQTVYAGTQGGSVLVYDLETFTVLRSLSATTSDVLNIVCAPNFDFFTAHQDGTLFHWNSDIHSQSSWKAHSSVVLALAIKETKEESSSDPQFPSTLNLLSTDDCGTLKSWEIKVEQSGSPPEQIQSAIGNKLDFLETLAQLVKIPSISGDIRHQQDCRRAAMTLRDIFEQLGASEANLLSTVGEKNPLVCASFKSKSSVKSHSSPKKRVLFYGHYDCIPASAGEWKVTHPFTMKGQNGYLYGRGVSDNKGPILAAAFAAHSLWSANELNIDIVFLIEGEEESGSTGFQDAVLRYKKVIGPIDAILVSNSYWIGDDRPCITYGLRGVIHSRIEISSAKEQLHSGVHGGSASEPMSDMVSLLSRLSDRNKINIPGFYDHVAPILEEDLKQYAHLAAITEKSEKDLIARWRLPNFTIHDISVTGEHNNTTIPNTVSANVSIRIVPNQKIHLIGQSMKQNLQDVFSSFNSKNSLQVIVREHADWWLGSPEGVYSKIMEAAIYDIWGKEPLRIREGGSIPSIPFLQTALSETSILEAVHIPIGQSSDNAHLADERIRLENLQKGQSVFKEFFVKVGQNSGI